MSQFYLIIVVLALKMKMKRAWRINAIRMSFFVAPFTVVVTVQHDHIATVVFHANVAMESYSIHSLELETNKVILTRNSLSCNVNFRITWHSISDLRKEWNCLEYGIKERTLERTHRIVDSQHCWVFAIDFGNEKWGLSSFLLLRMLFVLTGHTLNKNYLWANIWNLTWFLIVYGKC